MQSKSVVDLDPTMAHAPMDHVVVETVAVVQATVAVTMDLATLT